MSVIFSAPVLTTATPPTIHQELHGSEKLIDLMNLRTKYKHANIADNTA